MSIARLVNCPGCGNLTWEHDDLRGNVTLDPCPWLLAGHRPMNGWQRFMRFAFFWLRQVHDTSEDKG